MLKSPFFPSRSFNLNSILFFYLEGYLTYQLPHLTLKSSNAVLSRNREACVIKPLPSFDSLEPILAKIALLITFCSRSCLAGLECRFLRRDTNRKGKKSFSSPKIPFSGRTVLLCHLIYKTYLLTQEFPNSTEEWSRGDKTK